MYNYEKKTGHPVLGIVLGILGIIAALLLCLFTGVIGGAVAGILGLAAVPIGMTARKGGRESELKHFRSLVYKRPRSLAAFVQDSLRKKKELKGLADLSRGYCSFRKGKELNRKMFREG